MSVLIQWGLKDGSALSCCRRSRRDTDTSSFTHLTALCDIDLLSEHRLQMHSHFRIPSSLKDPHAYSSHSLAPASPLSTCILCEGNHT